MNRSISAGLGKNIERSNAGDLLVSDGPLGAVSDEQIRQNGWNSSQRNLRHTATMADFSAPLVDIGANLTNRQFQRDLPQVLRRAGEAGLDAIVLTGTAMAASRDALALAKRHGATSKVKLFSTVGVHPHDAKHFDEQQTVQEMRELIQHHPGIVCAIGECGLDFNRDFSPRDKQERVFRAQVELACELQLPLFLHEREAHDVFVRVLAPFRETGRLPPVVVHCFTGTERELQAYVAMGFYIGITGYVCMDARGFKLRTFVSHVPLDKLMIETDAPFMYPYGNNTRSRCEPKDLRAVVHTLASCYRTTPQEIALATTRNARHFFALGKCEAERGASPANGPNKRSTANHTRRLPDLSETKPSPALAAPPALPPVISMEDAIHLDGGSGEGGGQVIRIGMALAGVLKQKICITSIRAGRKIPGLRNQHVRTVQLAQQLSRGHVDGASIGSSQVVFDACHGQLVGGTFEAASETGGSVTLMMQGSLPTMLFASHPTTLTLRGGTHVGFSPPAEFMAEPFTQLLGRMGVQGMRLDLVTRGFFPGGRGEVSFTAAPLEKPLDAIDVSVVSQEITKITTHVTVYGEQASDALGQEFVGALKRGIKKRLVTTAATAFEWHVTAEVATAARSRGFQRSKKRPNDKGTGGHTGKPERSQVSILVSVETARGGLITADRTDKDTPEYAATKLLDVVTQHVAHDVCIDEHLADNAVVYMALASGTSRLRVPCKKHRTSQHLETALEIAEKLTGAKWKLEENDRNAVVTVHGVGFSPHRRKE
jgi:RNA 3'-phosphate cyclase